MAWKNLIVYLDQSERALLRLRLAAELARRHARRLMALYARGLSQEQFARCRSAELGLRSFNEMERLHHRMEDNIDSAAARLHADLDALAAQNQLSIDWRDIEDTSVEALAEAAREADLCIVGQDDPDSGSSISYGLGKSLLLQKGRPVIFVPALGEFATLGRKIVIAWDQSPTASGAVTAALPLLQRADGVTVVSVNPARLLHHSGGTAAEPLLEQLKQQGVPAVALSVEGVAVSAIAAALQHRALELGADLIVAGAYGHSRWREQLLGGVTRDLLATMRLPLMLSH